LENFTPVSALLGGLLIGAAATVLLAVNGRIAGISGILGGLLERSRPGDAAWRVLFLAGLILGTLAWRLAAPAGQDITLDASLPVLILGGLAVGLGTRLGGGCTSGHGVCGIARLSPRSIVATATFMLSAGLTVYLVRHVLAGAP